LVPVIGIAYAMVLMLVVSVGLLVTARNPQPEAMLPTLACNAETIQLWWDAQEIGLSQFAADASSASRTMPGERLMTRIATLRQFSDNATLRE
jgi:hypothetical protein